MGVWIETLNRSLAINPFKVTPYVGVWIETVRKRHRRPLGNVTPYVGVWIETGQDIQPYVCTVSLLMWECGLKHLCQPPSLIQLRHSLCGSVD